MRSQARRVEPRASGVAEAGRASPRPPPRAPRPPCRDHRTFVAARHTALHLARHLGGSVFAKEICTIGFCGLSGRLQALQSLLVPPCRSDLAFPPPVAQGWFLPDLRLWETCATDVLNALRCNCSYGRLLRVALPHWPHRRAHIAISRPKGPLPPPYNGFASSFGESLQYPTPFHAQCLAIHPSPTHHARTRLRTTTTTWGCLWPTPQCSSSADPCPSSPCHHSDAPSSRRECGAPTGGSATGWSSTPTPYKGC